MDSAKLDKGFNDAMQLPRLLLLPLGLWPVKSQVYPRFARPIAIATCLLVVFFVITPLCIFIGLATRDLKIRLQLISLLGFALMGLFKYGIVIYKHGKLAECILDMSLGWHELRDISEYKITINNAKTGRLFVIVCLFFMYGTGIPYVTVLPFFRGAVLHGNESLRPFSYANYHVLLYPQLQPIYDFVFVLHCMCGLITYTVSCGIYSIAIQIITHICSQITITRNMLNELVDNFDRKLLAEIVCQHRRLLKLASKFEDLFNKICMFEVIGNSCIIWFLSYHLMTEYENKETMALIMYSLLLVSFVFNIFVMSYFGEVLTEQCESIGQAAYAIDWHRLPRKEAQNIVLLIIRSQRPVYLTAGKMFNLSILSFSNIIRTTASYLNILRTVIGNSI